MKPLTWRLLVCLTLTVGMVAIPGPAEAAQCDGLKLCYEGSLGSKGGKLLSWYVSDKHPIPYWVNVSLLPAAKQATAIAAIKAAFAAFELPCTSIKFRYHGTHTSFSDLPTGILVALGDKAKDAGSWTHGNAAYWRHANHNSYQTGEITYGSIHLNAGLYGWNVAGTQIQAPPKATPHAIIDIKTAVMWSIPDMLGFQVVKDLSKPELPIEYKTQLTALCALHTKGAQYGYFKKTSASCTRPATVSTCTGGFDPGDIGVLGDGFYTDMPGRMDSSVWPSIDSGITPGADVGGGKGKACTSSTQCATDEVCTPQGYCEKTSEPDQGCGVAGTPGSGPAAAVLVLLMVLGGRRRRWYGGGRR